MENEILDIEKNKVDEDQNYTIAEEYRLPSEGKIYGVPFDPKIKLRSMTVQEEMMRANQSKSMNATLCEIIDRCLITKLPISTYDLALPDYEYLLHKLRVVSYGPEYKMVVGCPHCRKEQSYVANLDTLKVKPFDEKEYMNNFNKFSLSKEKCKDCGKNQKEVKGDFFYCSKCNKFICYSCLINHPYGDKHNIIIFQRYDSLCKIHFLSVDFLF